MRALKIGVWAIFTLAIITIAVVFSQQNSDPMTITFFQYTSDVQPKWKILLIASIVGALVTTVFFILELVVLEARNIRLTRSNKKLMRALEKHQRKDLPEGVTPEPAIKINPLDLDDDDDV
jgi:uncharacterized integral membrane protein